MCVPYVLYALLCAVSIKFAACAVCARYVLYLQKTAIAASEILRNERAVLTEVLDNNRCLLEFMNLMDSHKDVKP